MKIIRYLVYSCQISLLCILSVFGMEQSENSTNKRPLHVIVLPGQNNCGGEKEDYETYSTLPKYDSFRRYDSLGYGDSLNQARNIDLGQDNCIADFVRQLKNDTHAQNPNNDLMLYGISQGTATLVNWLGTNPVEAQRIKLLMLGAVLGHGNNAIFHTIKQTMPSLNKITYLPFSRLWVPIIAAKTNVPGYNQWGKQAIDSAKKINTTLPIVIIHAKHDFQLPINDARELYCALKQNGNNNTYLLEIDSADHIDVLMAPLLYGKNGNYSRDDIINKLCLLNTIYKKHNLDNVRCLDDCYTQNDLSLDELQPSIAEVKARINCDTDHSANRARNTIDSLSVISSASVVGFGISKSLKKQ